MSRWEDICISGYCLRQYHSEPYWYYRVLATYENSCMVYYKSKWYRNKNIIKYPYPSSMRKRDIRATYFCFYAIVSRVTLSKGKLFFIHTFQIKWTPWCYWDWSLNMLHECPWMQMHMSYFDHQCQGLIYLHSLLDIRQCVE